MDKEKDPQKQARAKAGWEKRKAEGKTKMSAQAKANISAGMKDNQIGRQMLCDRLRRLEEKLRQFGYSEEEIRML